MTVATTKPGKPSLGSFREQLRNIEEDTKDLCADLTPEQLTRQPLSGGWSVQECLVHLNVTGELYLAKMEPVLEASRARGEKGQAPLRYGLLGGPFIRSQEPPVHFKAKAPEVFRPVQTPDESVLPNFLAFQESVRDLLVRAEGLPLTKLSVTSPASKWLKLSVFEAFGLLLAHERRHLWQARRVKSELVP